MGGLLTDSLEDQTCPGWPSQAGLLTAGPEEEGKLGCLVQEDVRAKVGVATVHPLMPFPSP